MTNTQKKNAMKMAAVAAVFTLAFAFSFSAVFAREGESKGKTEGKNLSHGMRGEEVLKLQETLKNEGVFTGPVTGFFGDLTQKAVKEFQKKRNIPATGFVGPLTLGALSAENEPTVLHQEAAVQNTVKTAKPEATQANTMTLEEAQAQAGIIITGSISGPGYPTGPMNLSVPSTQLLLDRVGQVKNANAGQLEVRDRQYQVEFGTFPVTINGTVNNANEIKVISNIRVKNGVGQHQGTIDVDIDTIPGGHLTLAYNGRATVAGSTITSQGTFKTAKTTGIFAGLVAEGTYEMTIVESGNAFGSPATVTITTASP